MELGSLQTVRTSGHVVRLLGSNGAGKTIQAKIFMGLTLPDAGNVMLLGRPTARDLPELFRYHRVRYHRGRGSGGAALAQSGAHGDARCPPRRALALVGPGTVSSLSSGVVSVGLFSAARAVEVGKIGEVIQHHRMTRIGIVSHVLLPHSRTLTGGLTGAMYAAAQGPGTSLRLGPGAGAKPVPGVHRRDI